MVQELVEYAERQGRRNDAEEAHGVHYPARAQGVQLAKPASGEDEVRHQVVRKRPTERIRQKSPRLFGPDGI